MQRSAIRVVVADAGPLISLAILDLPPLLGRLFEQVQVPHVVLAECTARPELDDAKRIVASVAAGLLLPCDASPIEAPGLDAGERAAIGRAVEINAGLLADDLAARQHALLLGLTVIGTLGVLVRAKRQGMVSAVGPLAQRLRAAGQRLGDAAVAAALAAASETSGTP